MLVVPSKDGLELAMARVRDYLGWEVVREEIKKQQKDGNVDPARAQTMSINIDKARGRIPDAIRQAWSIVVTVSEKDEVQAFKITVTEEAHFNIIKGDKRSRMQDTPITAEALLPDGPYNLWRPGETARRVKDLAGAFAQLPHLPKMLKASAILNTLVDGCEKGTFVLRLTRPDGTFRTWWLSRPDENALNDPALELVLPEAAEMGEIDPSLLAPKKLPDLWKGDEISVKMAIDYFNGAMVVQVEREGYREPMHIPKAAPFIVEKAVDTAVGNGTLWLLSGPASILGEPIPPGVLNDDAKLCTPPTSIAAAEILPENLPTAWKKGYASGLSIATALSVRESKTLPWKTVKDVIGGALQARFLTLSEESQTWPCDFPSAQAVILMQQKMPLPQPLPLPKGLILHGEADLEPGQIQDLGDIVPKLLDIKKKSGLPLRFHVRIEMGDGKTAPPEKEAKELNALLKDIKEEWQLK
jgi:hypothetical protein